MVPKQLGQATLRGSAWRPAPAHPGVHDELGIAPALITSLSLVLAKSLSTLAAATGSRKCCRSADRPLVGQTGKRGIRRPRDAPGCFSSTRRYTPDLRAFARNRSCLPPRCHDTRQRRSSGRWQLAQHTSATTAFFSSRLRLKVLPPSVSKSLASECPARDLRRPCIRNRIRLGNTICVGVRAATEDETRHPSDTGD